MRPVWQCIPFRSKKLADTSFRIWELAYLRGNGVTQSLVKAVLSLDIMQVSLCTCNAAVPIV